MTPKQEQIKQAIQNSDVMADFITCKKDGTVEVKAGYFYRHSGTPEGWAQKVKNVLNKAGIQANVYGRDDYASWPKTSYFVAVVEA